MKKIITLATLGLMITAAPIVAQTVYDAAKITNKDLNGTARFVGMGGAMGALGGDISTLGTNPAGIGIYRSNDAMVSFGLSAYGTESNYIGCLLYTSIPLGLRSRSNVTISFSDIVVSTLFT